MLGDRLNQQAQYHAEQAKVFRFGYAQPAQVVTGWDRLTGQPRTDRDVLPSLSNGVLVLGRQYPVKGSALDCQLQRLLEPLADPLPPLDLGKFGSWLLYYPGEFSLADRGLSLAIDNSIGNTSPRPFGFLAAEGSIPQISATTFYAWFEGDLAIENVSGTARFRITAFFVGPIEGLPQNPYQISLDLVFFVGESYTLSLVRDTEDFSVTDPNFGNQRILVNDYREGRLAVASAYSLLVTVERNGMLTVDSSLTLAFAFGPKIKRMKIAI